MLNFVFACDSLNYDFRELPKWATCRKIWIVQTGESYSVKHTSLFNNFDFNIDMVLLHLFGAAFPYKAIG